MSDPAKLVMMANQIARNLEALGHDKAVAATAEHIRDFWDPRMKAGIAGAPGLSEIAEKAVQQVLAGTA